MPPPPTPPNLTLPRILCLHGGGVSSQIFTLQSRTLIASLPSHRLVFADAPFFCSMHPDLHPVYSDMGPTFLWSPWLPTQQSLTDVEDAIDEIEYALCTAMRTDSGTGEWIGLMGFSQGAMVSFSILVENELRKRACIQGGEEWNAPLGFAGADWRFGILLAGRAPPFSLSARTSENPYFAKPGRVGEVMDTSGNELKLGVPTVHVHGMRDEGLELHRRLERDYCVEGSGEVVEWDGEHRVPIKAGDVGRVVEAVGRCVARAGL